jgi:hypothetical protein
MPERESRASGDRTDDESEFRRPEASRVPEDGPDVLAGTFGDVESGQPARDGGPTDTPAIDGLTAGWPRDAGRHTSALRSPNYGFRHWPAVRDPGATGSPTWLVGVRFAVNGSTAGEV